MKTEPNAPANPLDAVWDKKDSITGKWSKAITQHRGLTKREYFAAMAMQGIRSNQNLMLDAEAASIQAVNDADALINALNKE